MSTNQYNMSEATKQTLIIIGFFTAIALITYFIFSN